MPRPYVPPPPAPGGAKPEESMGGNAFVPPGIPIAEIPPSSPIFPSTIPTGAPARKPKKTLFWILLIIVLIAGFAALGYYFVYPYFFGQTPVVQQQPAVSQPQPETQPATTTTASPPANVPPSITHVSFFKTPADTSEAVTLPTLDLASYKAAFSFATSEVAILNEALLEDTSQNVLSFAQVTGFLSPITFTANVAENFAPDFTFFTYTDNKGKWPGFIAKAKDGVSLSDVKSGAAKFEQSGEATNLFFTDPGTPGVWKGGETAGVTNRYLTLGLSGAGLNYGWSGNFLVVSASYNGFKEALRRLQ